MRCVRQPESRPRLAAILLGEQTQHLLRELFPATAVYVRDLFEGFLRVRRRVVRWGGARGPLDLPHSGVVAPEEELLQRLWQRVPALETLDPLSAEQGWCVQTTQPLRGMPLQDFGNRCAVFSSVELRAEVSADACWVESVEHGWLFLLSLGEGRATLIAAGAPPETLLADSRLVERQIARIGPGGAAVASHPRLGGVLATAEGIACGSAAIRFDPLCGEGAGNAVREAFLAAATIRASLNGHSRVALAEHYTARLRLGFLRHLQMCRQFYSTGGDGAFWSDATASLDAGVEQLSPLAQQGAAARFRLADRELLPLIPPE